ncbi:tyrosine-type recombinase/integrase [Nocardioides panacihumi]|uniref:Tyrosine-type recombinase/integrase n=1 Tax=Nocardioides panacihumi TaxID=400774 RepID=A0ABP5BXC4_9ACTN
MSRPRTPIGTFGDISFQTMPSGQVRARVRFRDDDGQLRQVTATGTSRRKAETTLKSKLLERPEQLRGTGELTPDTPFPKLAEIWLAELDAEGHLSTSTRQLYERDLATIVLPAFEHYTLREISISKVDRFLKAQATLSYSRAKHAKLVLSLCLGLALRWEAIARNPVAGTTRLRKPPTAATSLTAAQVEAIRRAARGWRRSGGLVGPKPDGQLEAIIEVMLGTSARIGEALAIRKCDVDVTSTPATVRICGTVVSPKGMATYRQDHPKTSRSSRTVAVPSFTAQVLRLRLAALADEDPEHLIFHSRNHTPLTTANVRRRLRAILAEAGITGVTPHSFRRTVATVIDRASGADLAAEMLGHTSSRITKLHYIEPNERVNPLTAQILESLAPQGTADQTADEPGTD